MADPVLELVVDLVRKLIDGQQAMREEMTEMRHDPEAQFHDLRLELRGELRAGAARVDKDIANLRQTVFVQDASLIGQGALISDPMLCVKRHLGFAPPAAV